MKVIVNDEYNTQVITPVLVPVLSCCSVIFFFEFQALDTLATSIAILSYAPRPRSHLLTRHNHLPFSSVSTVTCAAVGSN